MGETEKGKLMDYNYHHVALLKQTRDSLRSMRERLRGFDNKHRPVTSDGAVAEGLRALETWLDLSPESRAFVAMTSARTGQTMADVMDACIKVRMAQTQEGEQ